MRHQVSLVPIADKFVSKVQTNPPPLCRLIRNIDLNNDEEVVAFKWYWEVALRKIGGVLPWSERIRHFTTISRAVCPQDPSLLWMDISTEAFLVLLWENCLPKWTETLAWKKANPSKKAVKRSKTTKNMKQFKAKFTTQDGGQKPFGGWGPTGITRFNEIYDLIGAAKFEGFGTKDQSATPKESWMKLEDDFLVRLRKDLKIEAEDA